MFLLMFFSYGLPSESLGRSVSIYPNFSIVQLCILLKV
ncbi:hypothetical protein [Escherichia phage FL23]